MNVQVNPDDDTEWNDILRKNGVLPPKPPSPTPIIEEALRDAIVLAHENRLEDKDLDELDALEDDEDDEFLNMYRQKRLAELSTIAAASAYGQVFPVQKVDYSREITEDSKKAFVCLLLNSSHGENVESRVVTDIWRNLATRFGDVKFAQMRADLCIEGYPDRNTPTLLIYHDGHVQKQMVTLKELNGPRTSQRDVEQLLVRLGAVKGNDKRLKRNNEDGEESDYDED